MNRKINMNFEKNPGKKKEYIFITSLSKLWCSLFWSWILSASFEIPINFSIHKNLISKDRPKWRQQSFFNKNVKKHCFGHRSKPIQDSKASKRRIASGTSASIDEFDIQ